MYLYICILQSTQGHGRRYWRYRDAYKDDVDNSSSASSEKYRPPRPTVAATTEAPPQVAESSIDIRLTEDEPPKYETNVIIPAGPGPAVSKRQQEPTTIPTTTPRPIRPRPTRPPYDLQRVNDGVSTILGGVGSLRLSEILRGSFMFTRNNRVRDVANTVIDSIFGPRPENLPAKAGQGFLAGL
jgi:hypothetical protein